MNSRSPHKLSTLFLIPMVQPVKWEYTLDFRVGKELAVKRVKRK